MFGLVGVYDCETTRKSFLNRLQTKGRFKYKRYKGLPLRYAGGKSLGVGHIVENIPENIKRLVSPFFGGGSVEIACNKELGIEIVGYDIFDVLINYWNIQISNPVALAKKIEDWKPTSEAYKHVKERLKNHWKGEDTIENELELAAHYWFNHNLSYGPGFLGWMSKIYQDEKRFHRLVGKVRDFKCQSLRVSQMSFVDSIPNHQDDFLYCDPPYFLGEDSRMFRGIYPQRNFPIHHKGFEHERLRDLLYQHKGGFILSYNDCETIREWYEDYEIREVKWQYTLGQGETRIGKNRIENGTYHYVKQSHELVIVGKKKCV